MCVPDFHQHLMFTCVQMLCMAPHTRSSACSRVLTRNVLRMQAKGELLIVWSRANLVISAL